MAFGNAFGQQPCLEPRSGLDALRSGRFDAAAECFDRLARSRPHDPEGPFLQAFHLWWLLLDDRPAERELRIRMENLLVEAETRASALTATGDAALERRGLVYAGTALLLDAQSRAARGGHLAAASAARRGHKALTRALRLDPESREALFAMGAYNYYADKVPLLVKGLRFLLFIPGGDEELGIRQLETAAEQGGLFSTEALMLLSHIFSGGYEEDYRRALGYLERASAAHPDSPLIELVHSDHLYAMGRFAESAERARRALSRVENSPHYSPELSRFAAYRVAACTLRLHDPLEALDLADRALGTLDAAGPSEIRRWMILLAAAAREAGRPERLAAWLEKTDLDGRLAASLRKKAAVSGGDRVAAARAEALSWVADGRPEEGRGRLAALLAEYPADPRLHYDLGRLFQQDGRLDDARPHLVAAADSAPPDLAGWALLRLGWDLERRGLRKEAAAHYKRASELKQFTFQAAARVRLEHPGEAPPEG